MESDKERSDSTVTTPEKLDDTSPALTDELAETPKHIQKWGDFSITETFDCENGSTIFKRTAYICRDPKTYARYYGDLARRKKQITLEQAIACSRKIPDREVFPDYNAESFVTPAIPLDAMGEGVYAKQLKLSNYKISGGGTYFAEQLLAEALFHDTLQQRPHPNIVRFMGCVVRDSLIVAIGLEKYPHNLSDLMKADRQKALLYSHDIFIGVSAGIQHLHGMRIAHNDINPHNILISAMGHAVITDFGSAMSFGQQLIEGGTPEWNDGFGDLSAAEHDMIGLAKLENWLGLCK